MMAAVYCNGISAAHMYSALHQFWGHFGGQCRHAAALIHLFWKQKALHTVKSCKASMLLYFVVFLLEVTAVCRTNDALRMSTTYSAKQDSDFIL